MDRDGQPTLEYKVKSIYFFIETNKNTDIIMRIKGEINKSIE